MIKITTFSLYAIAILVMAMATFVEKERGTAWVLENIYGSWWFCALWALIAVSAMTYIWLRRIRRTGVLLLHFAFVVILFGALITHITAWTGTIRLRQGQSTDLCLLDHTNDTRPLPFSLTLDSFRINYHNGTMSPSDYESHLTIHTQGQSHHAVVSMNRIYKEEGVRLYQSAYDDDMKGTTLSVNSDPWGIPITYTGYALLLLSMCLLFVHPKGQFRTLLRKAQALLIVCCFLPLQSHASPTLTPRQAEDFGKLCINYRDRICPVQTLAIDFTRKLHGKSSYKGYTPQQVLCGFALYRDAWNSEPILRVKSKELRKRLALPEYTSIASLFTDQGYVLGPYIHEYYMGNQDKLHEEAMKLDDKVMLAMQVSRGEWLRIFPFQGRWYAPTDSIASTMESERNAYIRHALPLLAELATDNRSDEVDEMIRKMTAYQQRYGADDLPSPVRLYAEHLLNDIPFITILFILCLTCFPLGLMRHHWAEKLALIILSLALATLTTAIALRWTVSGTIPMTNGYETLMLMAWAVMIAALFARRTFRVMAVFGLLVPGFLLLVGHLSQMDPAIGHIMPVLSSPLLSIHVSCVMAAYALFSLTFACGIYALVRPTKSEEMHLLSCLLLYPALFLLAAGIFTGAIWANVSWGRYWGWDPKEVWALITMMIYALPMHSTSLPWLRKPTHYHTFMVVAFLAVLVTYFGVTFFLGGLHSYA